MSYKPKTWKAVCQVSGIVTTADKLKRRWDGLWVLPDYWETRHPADLIRTPREKSNQLPFTSVEPEGLDVSPNYAIETRFP